MALVDKVWQSVSKQPNPLEASHESRTGVNASDSSVRRSSGSGVSDLAGYAGDNDYLAPDVSRQAAGSHVIAFDDSDVDSMNRSSMFGDFTKRAIDISASLTLLVVLLPVLIALAGIVSKDGGVAIFSHERIGRGGRTFKCLKFRSMVKDADAVLSELLAKDPRAREEWNRDFKLKDDIRITPVGRILRRTSLDELPQLWNVLRGDMSLVGPRPIVQKELLRYGADARFYLMVKPGMTGLWQVSGRNNIDYATRVSLDVSYVKDRSLLLDVTILLRTFKVVFEKDGAY
ncbi:transmembrane sugar transferase [Caballeronia temeraria]|uniref:Transmembrane sugar transferase n=1 Tax=Caballeronia temeraria TaxID=1777137 RepID=A0A157ZVP8_9BURK|nr:sugar transferase [Caballeronia temeraria]SAK49569.1 transmembrane sugar transferase [Caballeronia temeraria]